MKLTWVMLAILVALAGVSKAPRSSVAAATAGAALPAVAGQPGPSLPALQGAFGTPSTFATHAQLAAYGFAFGPSDGPFGAIAGSGGSYTFYGAAGSASSCPGGSGVREGAFAFTGTLDRVIGANGCVKLFGPGDGPPGWVFDRDYAGGGPVIPFSSGGQSGWLMSIHGEYQWPDPNSADHRCNGVPCFYSSIGLAVSTDNGKTFKVAGQVVQPSQPLATFMGGGTNMSVGYGSLIVADANGQHLDNPPADPSSAYLYVFFADLFPGAPGICARTYCLAIARAPYSDAIAAVLSGDPNRVATVFHKYDGAAPDGWTQPATSDTPDLSGTSGTYAPLWTDEQTVQPDVIYDSAFNVYLAVYESGPFGGRFTVRASSDLLHWSAPIATPYTEQGRVLYQPSLLGENGDPTTAGSAPRIYFTSFPAGAFPNWTNSMLESVTLTLSPAGAESSP